ncbi:uncharacterized protein LY89DRAFT_740039 [Mollisia scopiformis]|uniref:Uncharacterized protein n=1 Tax=Mollisia scopiformis TaxID=149040 RepID=A0A132BD65_MOLSC|nr:uncharacterized protein LY89DRAFT_740039 [Mollisia scopiformis]KUJ10311.1 hypothetical protein LY89DRAFT_740039 [Mollisia scopiformis]
MQMISCIPYLPLPLTIFTFVSIILINVGGVNPNYTSSSSNYFVLEKNSAFNLVNWNYTITPLQSFGSYEYHLYLNRLCSFAKSQPPSYSLSPSIVSGNCINDRNTGEFEDGRHLYAPNALVGSLSPFRFSTVYLVVPFAFYILTAICAFFLMVCVIFGGKRLGRGGAIACTVISGLAMIFVIIASAAITGQMYHLKDQIENDTRRITALSSQTIGSQIGDTTDWTTTINHVSVGSVVLGLTWASAVAMMIEFFMWVWAAIAVRKESPNIAMKDEHRVQG